jgi:hypothetical protein
MFGLSYDEGAVTKDALKELVRSAIREAERRNGATEQTPVSRFAKYKENPVDFFSDVLNHYLWSKQREICEALTKYDRVAVKSAHQVGKALTLDTPLPTPYGWTTMGEIQVGDKLYDERGKICRVTALSDIRIRDCYRIVFDDRSEICASGDHSWNVTSFLDRAKTRKNQKVRDWREHWNIGKTKTTIDLIEGGVDFDVRYNQSNWAIPLGLPIEGRFIDIGIPPYLLGIWLAEGTALNGSVTISHEDRDEIFSNLYSEGVEPVLRPSSMKNGAAVYNVPGLKSKLLELGLINNKHIPPAIMRSDYATRLSVLQGLMDGDGWKGEEGNKVKNRAAIALSNEKLANDVYELIVSLGFKVRVRTKLPVNTTNGKTGKLSYEMGFRPNVQVYRVKRKLDKCPGTDNTYQSSHTQRMIKSIERIDDALTKCITVDSPSRIFLAGRSFIPTHNSFLAGGVVTWWISSHPLRDAMAVTTAPTFPQVRSILWKEINRNHELGKLPGYTNQTEWFIDKEMVAFGRKPSDYSPAAFQGIHAKYLLGVLDEACGIPASLWPALESLVTNEGSKLLAIGNPDDPGTEFAKICKPGSGWHVIRISAFDSPAFTGEDVPSNVVERLVSRRWVEDMKRAWGENNPLYISKVLGEFPDVSDDTLVQPGWVADAVRRELPPESGDLNELGVDVARSIARNETVIYHRHGCQARLWKAIRTQDTMKIVGLIVQAVIETGARTIKVDDVGVGGGVTDRLKELVKEKSFNSPNPMSGVHVIGVNVGQPPIERRKDKKENIDPRVRYYNQKSQFSWELRERFREGLIDLDDDLDTQAQICAIRYENDSRGRLRIESKEDVQERLSKMGGMTGESGSPDRWDALVLVFAEVDERKPFVISDEALARSRIPMGARM